nr:molybdenum metabolism regulator [Bacillus spizizenii]
MLQTFMQKSYLSSLWAAAYITEETLDEEGYPQNEDLLSVAIEALTYMKTGNDEWDDEVHDELLDALEQKGLAESDGIELDWEEEDLPQRFPKLWERFGENPLF